MIEIPFGKYKNLKDCISKNQDKKNPAAYCASIEHATQGKSVFFTDALSYEEIGMKGDRNYYVTGYISTPELDRQNEVVTAQAMDEMLHQLKTGNIKLDIEHSTFKGDVDIPIGRIVDAKIDSKGLWVKATLNKSHAKFEEVWKSIKDGFLDAFSIAYKVKDVVEDVVGGISRRLLRSLELLNVAITGCPANAGATMTDSFVKSVKNFRKNMEENTMGEEQPAEEQPAEEKPTEEKPTEEAQAEEKPTEEPAKEAESEEKSVEEKPAEEKPADANPLDEIKSLKKEIASLKSSFDKEIKQLNDRMEKPKLKSVHSEMPKDAPQKPINPIDLIQ